jgi:gentisate 1,2-dioxygenase
MTEQNVLQPGNLRSFSRYLVDNQRPREESVIWKQSSILQALQTEEFTARGALFLENPHREKQGETLHDLSVTVQVIPAGDRTTPHSHSFWHLYVVISGKGELVLDNKSPTPLASGDVIYVPAWSEHQFINQEDENLVLYVIQNLPGMAKQGTLLRNDGDKTYSPHSK